MPIIDRHLVFSFIMSDKEGEEDPKVISVGSFEDLRSYFDQKFSHLKRELSDNQLKSSSSLVKKLKSETNLSFKFSGNKKQFDFNTETLEHITQSLSFVDSLKSLVDLENSENHQVSDEVASGSEDEKKIRAAERRALRKKNARIAKPGQKLSILICAFIRFLCPCFSFFSV